MTENLFARGPDDDLRALATIDPAGPRDPQAHLSVEARRTLASITATEPSAVATGVARERRRWPWLVAAAAAAAAVIAIVPTIGSGGAYASWTDVPAAATAAGAARAERECRDLWISIAETPGPGLPAVEVVEGADLVIAEQRGEFTYTVLSDGDWGMDCLVHTRSGFWWGGRTDGGSGGSLQPLGDSGQLAPDGIADLMLGGFGGQDIDGMVLMMYARVGADVGAAVVHTPGAGDVEATVTNGYLAAWAPGLPEDALDDPAIGITLYLTDGTVVEMTPTEVEAIDLANRG